jgi:hypothetical protein
MSDEQNFKFLFDNPNIDGLKKYIKNVKKNKKFNVYDTFYFLCAYGDIKLIKWYYDKHINTFSMWLTECFNNNKLILFYGLLYAINNDHLDIVKWLFPKININKYNIYFEMNVLYFMINCKSAKMLSYVLSILLVDIEALMMTNYIVKAYNYYLLTDNKECMRKILSMILCEYIIVSGIRIRLHGFTRIEYKTLLRKKLT